MPQRVLARSGLFAPPGGLLSVGVLTAALLWAWYAWIFSPTLGLERDRAIAGNVVREPHRSPAVGRNVRRRSRARSRARVAARIAAHRAARRRRRGPAVGRLQHLEDALRLGTYDPVVHRAALNELRALQLQLIARSQRHRDDRGANEPAHQPDVHRAARGCASRWRSASARDLPNAA